MTVDPRLLEIIACPKCRGALTLGVEELICDACALAYPIKNGIPVLLIDSAKKRG